MNARHLVAAALALAITATSSTTASATPAFSLRVEAPGTTIDPGTYYAPRSPVNAQRGELAGSGNCVRTSGDIPLAGQTALGLVASAANANGALGPLLVAEDAFGKRICRIGVFNETDSPFTGWLYRVNHVAPSLSGELTGLTRTDEVLWAFANFGSGENTGDELVVSAPLQNAPGTIPVTVKAVTFDGNVKNAPDGTVVTGGTSPVTTVGGVATVSVASGFATLRATGPGAVPTEIPSNQLRICAFANPADCPPSPGRSIVGTDLRDKFKGTGGPDTIRSRGGNDRVIVRGGGIDLVKCGKGKDLAVGDSTDRLRGCEKVRTGS
jgi:hypothetical protein